MVNNPIIPLDNFNILQEVEKTKERTNKGKDTTVRRVEQGKETFINYTFSDAVQELDELFKSS